MALEFKLPDIGEGVAEGEIVKWLVQEGDSVGEHQAVVEVMTDKATVEIPAPAAGTVSKILVGEGDVVPVGDVIFHLEKGEGGGASASDEEPKEEDSKKEDSKKEDSKKEPAKEGGSEKEAPAPAAKARKSASSSEDDTSDSTSSTATATASAPSGKTIEFKLPDIGEGVAEGEIVKWLVEEGATVDEHQAVVEVMTDKATVEIPAPAAGKVAKIHAGEGDVVPVGQVIFDLAVSGGGAPAEESADEPADSQQEAPDEEASAPAAATKSAPASNGHSNGKVLAVPSARRAARELGVDLTRVSGSGRNGVIRRADVEEFARGGEAAPEAPATEAAPAAPSPQPITVPSGEAETRVPFRGVRRKIADAMTRSKFTAVHFTVVEELDVTNLVALRAKAKAIGAEQDVKVTYMPFIMKAVANCLGHFPELNSQLDESTQEVVTFRDVHLGIATDTPQGLIVPVIRDVQAKGLLQLASELGDLAQRTRSGQVKPDELRGSTFTITNAGNIGGTLATPVINFPEVGILGVHRIVKRPGVVETPEGDAFEVRHYMNLSISVDHRLVDGASAARFLVRMKTLLEEPGLLSL